MPEPTRLTGPLRRLVGALHGAGAEWRHGYVLSQETGLKSGTLYPLLIRLHALGLIDKKWGAPEAEGRPPRHLYRLNAGGKAFARKLSATPLPGVLAWDVKS
jgi:PadR family transcriptional regulator